MNNPKALKNSVESGHSNDTTVEGWQLGNQFWKVGSLSEHSLFQHVDSKLKGAGGTSGTGGSGARRLYPDFTNCDDSHLCGIRRQTYY